MKPRIAIVGAGISGLALGWFLKKYFGDDLSLTILESSDRVGGWIRTRRCGDFLFEEGPRSCRTRGTAVETLQLIEELGLEKEVIAASPSAMNRYIYTDDRLHNVPNSIFSFLTSPLTYGVLPALWREWKTPVGGNHDESIADFIERRFGADIAERFIDPLVSGIYAGDTRHLSVRSCFPDLYHMEQESGSIVKGMLKRAFRKKTDLVQTSPFVQKMLKTPIFSFQNGMETLPRRLQDVLSKELKTRCKVVSLEIKPEGIDVVTEHHGILQVDHVFLALPAQGAATLLKSDKIAEMSSATVAVVNMGWRDNVLQKKGFGYLIPSREQEDILGVVWDSSVFPQQNHTPEQTRLTVMLGGTHHPDIEKMSNEDIMNCAVKALSKHLEIKKKPDVVHIVIARQAIPQYTVDHHIKTESIKEALSVLSTSRIHLIGSAWEGVSIHDCVSNAKKHAKCFGITSSV